MYPVEIRRNDLKLNFPGRRCDEGKKDKPDLVVRHYHQLSGSLLLL
jgi:hypothetical protein